MIFHSFIHSFTHWSLLASTFFFFLLSFSGLISAHLLAIQEAPLHPSFEYNNVLGPFSFFFFFSPLFLSSFFFFSFSSNIDNFFCQELLVLAEDLGRRLLPAFETNTGMPYGTVNLKHGVPHNETPIACTSCTSTFSLEFGYLSLLTGDAVFYEAAKTSVRGLWERRSALGLVGSHIDVQTGAWTQTVSRAAHAHTHRERPTFQTF